MTEIQEGMRIERQDAGAFYGPFLHKVIDSGETLFPVGFYFKWFTRPALLSRVFLKSLRPLAGSGRLPESTSWQDRAAAHLAEEQSPSRDWGNFDEVIVGAGLSGLLAAAEAHGRILLVDDQLELGGQRHGALQLLAKSLGPKLIEFPCLARAQQSLEQAVTDLPVDTVLNQALGSRIVAGYAPDSLVLHTGQHLVTLRTRTLTWTAGALDVLGLFPGNDLPGLWGPRALYRVLVRDSMRVSGQKVIVYGHGLDLWLAAALLHAGGAQVTVVLNDIPRAVVTAVVHHQHPHTFTIDAVRHFGQQIFQVFRLIVGRYQYHNVLDAFGCSVQIARADFTDQFIELKPEAFDL